MPTKPTVLFHDDFSSYGLGTYPTGWLPGGNGAFVATDPFNRYVHVFQQFASSHNYKDLGVAYTDATVYFAFSAQGQATLTPYIMGFENSAPNEVGNAKILAAVNIESDYTLSCRAGIGQTLIGNSKIPMSNGWNWLQVNCTVFDVAGTTWVTMSMCMNGQTVITGGSAATPFLTASLFTGLANFNFWVFNSPNFFGGIYTDVTLCSPSASLGNDPFSYTGSTWTGSPSHARVSQGFLEVAELPTTQNARVSQGFLEVVELPSSQNARVSQGFIELITPGGSGGGWKVKEA